jgi:phage protein D
MVPDGRGGIRRHQAIAATREGWDPAAMTTSLLFLAAATPLHSSITARSARRWRTDTDGDVVEYMVARKDFGAMDQPPGAAAAGSRAHIP